MNSQVVMRGLAAIGLAFVVLQSDGRADGTPYPCDTVGPWMCVPNVRNYGYYPTQWRRWATEVRRDEKFPESVGRERIPTPPGDPTEPMPIERIPSRSVPGAGELPLPADLLPSDNILLPEGPFQPEAPMTPQEPAVPGGAAPFVPSRLPDAGPARELHNLPTPAPAQRSSDLRVPGRSPAWQQDAAQAARHSQAQSQPYVPPVVPEPEPMLQQPAQTQPRFDAVHYESSAGDRAPIRQTQHVSDGASRAVSQASYGKPYEEPAAPPRANEQNEVDPPLVLEGFCPVTLSTREEWRQGQREYMAVHQGRAFHMAGPEERRLFLANPERYAPMFGGIDPVLVVDQQRWTPGSIQYSATYKGRIYMLSSEANLKRFHADPRRYAFELEE